MRYIDWLAVNQAEQEGLDTSDEVSGVRAFQRVVGGGGGGTSMRRHEGEGMRLYQALIGDSLRMTSLWIAV